MYIPKYADPQEEEYWEPAVEDTDYVPDELLWTDDGDYEEERRNR